MAPPPKNSMASTCASTHDASSMDSTGRRNNNREQVNTMMNPHTRRVRCVTGSNQRPSRP